MNETGSQPYINLIHPEPHDVTKTPDDSHFKPVIFCLILFVLGIIAATFKYLTSHFQVHNIFTGVGRNYFFSRLDSAAREERAIQAVTPDPVPASKFVSVYKQRLKTKQLATEFKALVRNQEDHPSQAALRNVLLNTKQDVVSCDHSRVIVWEGCDVTGSDYYNASYIDGYNGPKEYIASQGPSSKTFALFWHMIWQEGVTCVVMATGLFENAVQQCDKYWVDHSRKHARYGKIHVWHEKSTYLAQLNIRSFRIQKEGCYESRVLTHYEMVGLHEECPSAGLLLDVRRRVNAQTAQSNGPVLVHCRCGGGRSAVYLAVEYCLQKLQAEDRVDVYSTVLHLRRFRKNMVKTVQQYQQVYDAVAMYIQCGVTVYPGHMLPDVYRIHYARRGESKSRLDREFQSLQTIVPKLSIGDCASGHRVENRSKSRDIMMLPPECARPYLNTADCGDGGTDFINGVYIDGYHAENTYLVTQWPMKRTIADVWRLVFDFKITCLVVMNEVGKFSRNYPRFWPKEINQVASYGPISVRYISCNRRPDLVIRTFAIRKPKRHPHLIAQALVRISEDVMIMNNLVGCELRQDEIVVKMFQVVGGAGNRSSYRRKSLRKQSYQNRQLKVDLHIDDPRRGSYDMDDVPMDCCDDDHDKKSSGVGLQSRSLLSVMEHVEDWQKRSASRQSVCIMSKDGCSRAGLYCTISICCDQLKTEKEIDVFSAVRYVRTHRPQMVPTLEEYRYIYHFMMEFVLLSKSRPDIIVTQPIPSIFTCSEFEKSTDTMAIIANSLHGGVYIRNQPVQPDMNQPDSLGNSLLKHEYLSTGIPDLKNSIRSGSDHKEEDNQSDPHSNLVTSISREVVPSFGSQRNSPKELVVGRGSGTLSNSKVKDSHSKIQPSSDGLSLTPPITQTTGFDSLTGHQPLSAVSLLSIANSYEKHLDEVKLQTPSSWSNHLKDCQSLSSDVNLSPCASASNFHHASLGGDPCDQTSNLPMQSSIDTHRQKCFLSPGLYAQGSQMNKASLSSLCTNSSFHSCHSNLSEALSQTAGSPKPCSHTSNSGLSGGAFNYIPNGFHPYPFSDIGSSHDRCASFMSLSTDLPGMHNSQTNHLSPAGTPLKTPAESTLIHASYASLEDSVGDSLEDHYSSLEWVEQNNNAHMFKQGIQAEVTARNEARFMVGKTGMRHSLFSRSRVIPWPSPLNFVKKVKEYRLSKRKTLISDL